MRIHELKLADFRSYEHLRAAFPAGPQVVVGQNAAGKTNLLEALLVLSLGRSHRAHADQELVRWGADVARVEAAVSREPVSSTLETLEVALALPSGSVGPGGALAAAGLGAGPAVRPGAASRGRKRIRVNGVGRRPDALSATLRTVLFAPESMLLVSGSPSLRRDELDSIVAQLRPGHARSLATYGRVLTQRNSLLRLIREGAADPGQLPYWDGILVDEGGAIVERRLRVLEALAGPLESAHDEIAPGEESLRLAYETNAPANAAETPRDALRRRLAETSEKELWNGQTLVGPHRDDVRFLLGGRDLAAFGSRGQQRTAILALKLAELDLLGRGDGVPPLLLLDDVFSELDPDRRAHLVRRIGALPQAFVTTTALEDLDPALVAESTAWRVTPGRLERLA